MGGIVYKLEPGRITASLSGSKKSANTFPKKEIEEFSKETGIPIKGKAGNPVKVQAGLENLAAALGSSDRYDTHKIKDLLADYGLNTLQIAQRFSDKKGDRAIKELIKLTLEYDKIPDIEENLSKELKRYERADYQPVPIFANSDTVFQAGEEYTFKMEDCYPETAPAPPKATPPAARPPIIELAIGPISKDIVLIVLPQLKERLSEFFDDTDKDKLYAKPNIRDLLKPSDSDSAEEKELKRRISLFLVL